MSTLLYVCLDGLGDDPIPEFDGRTPLEAADTPNLDALAAAGATGTVVTVGPGIAPESDIGVFGILGYDPNEEHPGRGVLEALGIGMDLRDGDLAYRINFATARWPEILDRRVGRDLSSEEAHALADEVNRTLRLEGATFDLRATIEHRGALVIRTDDGEALSASVTNTDPAYERRGHLGVALETFEPVVVTATPLESTPAARRAADLTNAFVEGSARDPRRREVNERRRGEGKLPGNLILTRDGGDRRPALAAHRRAVRHGVGVLRGDAGRARHLARARHATGRRPTPRCGRLRRRGRGARTRNGRTWPPTRSATSRRSTCISRVPTCPPTTGVPPTSATWSPRSTEPSSARSCRGLRAGTVVAVTADHATSCVRKAHTADPVPLLVSGGPVTSDGTTSFGERACADGSLGELLGPQILPRLSALLRG